MSFLRWFAALIAISPFALAGGVGGLAYSHNDWELACDNTRICRAAGYHHSDGDDFAVSVLLTRNAGPNAPVIGRVMIGEYGENPAVESLPPTFTLMLRIDNRAIGKITVQKNSLVADLTAEQVSALLRALTRNSSIEFSAGNHRWRLSDKGAAAVLLKMDEFQGRIGTPGALARKGRKSEETVLPPLPAPIVVHAPFHKGLPGDEQFATKNSKALLTALRNSVPSDSVCYEHLLNEDETSGAPKLEAVRLSETKMLVYGLCWMAAYNFGYGYWVVNASRPYEPMLVTDSGPTNPDRSGTISVSLKGRGLGDCWSSDTWTWDGKQFIHTESSSTGMCRLLAPGGAWELPTLVTNVR